MKSRNRIWAKRCLVLVFVALFIQMASVVGPRWMGGQYGLKDSQTASFYTTVIQRFAPMRAVADAPWSNTTFLIYQDLPVDYTCDNIKDEGHRLQSCKKVKQLVDYMVSKQEDTKSPDLYVVPMDYLALHATENTNKSQAVATVLDTMTRGMRYLHFGGSDHVFLCLTEDCGEIMHEIMVRHRLGKDTRAMWVGAEEYLQDFREQWPCPDRVINAPEPLLKFIQLPTSQSEPDEPTFNALNRGARSLLQTAVKQVEGMNRWACSKAKWDIDLKPSGLLQYQGCVAVARHNLCVTVIPKCASSTMKILLERMSGVPNWNDPTRSAHGRDNGLTSVNPGKHYNEYIGNFTDTSVIKIAVIRDPEKRLLSGYLDKFVEKHLFGSLGFNKEADRIPSLEEVINRLMSYVKDGTINQINHHYRPQSNFGSLRDVRYDFVATVSSLIDDLETILTPLGLWEMYGASGWGEDGTLSFAEDKGRNRRPKSIHPVQPTPEQREKIYKIYSEDYHRLGFPMKN